MHSESLKIFPQLFYRLHFGGGFGLVNSTCTCAPIHNRLSEWGSEVSLANVIISTRYTMANPFSGYEAYVVVQLQYGGGRMKNPC